MSLRVGSRPADLLLGHAPNLRRRAVAALCVVTASAALTLSVWRHMELRSQVQGAEAVATGNAQRAQAAVPRAVPAISRAQLLALDRMVYQLNTPWPAILDALEEHVSPQVALLSIEPDAGQGRVRLEFEARQLPPLMDFARRLEGSSQFLRVNFVRHELVEREPGTPYRMVLEAMLPTAADARPGARP